MSNVLGSRLKEEREKRGWTQVYVANRLGMKRSSTYANWEYGLRDPDTDMLSKCAELFEVSTDYLLGKDDQTSPTPDEKPWLDDPRLLELVNKLKSLSDQDQEIIYQQTKTLIDLMASKK